MNLKEVLYSNLQTMDIVELYGYINEIELGYINANCHPEDDNLVILNYTEIATYDKRWNKYTMSARGLILDLTKVKDNGVIYILARPFEKFPNYGSNEIEGYEDDIDFTQVESVMEKMDGSLGISYFFKDEIRFATRGSFSSEQALVATELWRENHAKYEEDLCAYANVPATYLVEIIYPENRVVVNYGEDRKLVLLGVNYLFSDINIDVRYEGLKLESKYLHIELAKQYNYSIDMMIEMKKLISANEEGWIVKFKNGKRLKIKGDEYINVHRIMHGLSDKAKVGAWAEGRMNDYIKALPEEFRPELEKFADDLDRFKDSLYTVLQVVFEYVSENTVDRKSFALMVNSIVDREYRHFMFDGLKHNSISVDLIREHIYKNYIEYLEVIRIWKK